MFRRIVNNDEKLMIKMYPEMFRYSDLFASKETNAAIAARCVSYVGSVYVVVNYRRHDELTRHRVFSSGTCEVRFG